MVLVLGVGEKAKVDAEVFRRAAARLVSWTGPAKRAATTLLAAAPDVPGAAQAIAEGAALAAYRFTEFKEYGVEAVSSSSELVVVGSGVGAPCRPASTGVRPSPVPCAWPATSSTSRPAR